MTPLFDKPGLPVPEMLPMPYFLLQSKIVPIAMGTIQPNITETEKSIEGRKGQCWLT